jgi:hypothetical protein
LIVNKKKQFFLTIITYKKQDANIMLGKRKKKSALKTHHLFAVDITPPLERVHQGGSNIVAKGRTTTLNKY